MIIGYLPSFSSTNLSSDNLKVAFDFLRNYLEMGTFLESKVELKGEEIVVMFSENLNGRELQLESHLKYIDIHFVIEGNDRFAYVPRGGDGVLEISRSEENDLILYSGNFETEFEIKSNSFVVFFPEDIHSPCYKTVTNKKLVFKVAVQ